MSGTRLGAELRLTLAEVPAVALAALEELEALGALAALESGLQVHRELTERALELLGAQDRGDLLVLAALALEMSGTRLRELRGWLDLLAFPAGDRDAVVGAVGAVPGLLARLPRIHTGSQLHAAASHAGPLAMALAGAHGPAEAEQARRWLDTLRHVRLQISGHDLLAAGIPPGPEVGRRLAGVLARRMDGELAGGRDAELAAALADPLAQVRRLPSR